MLFSRTRKKLAFKVRKLIFDWGGLQGMLDQAETRVLEQSMGFPGQWEEHRRFQFEFLCSNGLQPGSRLLEFGCGPLTLGIPAIEFLDSHRYVGIDVRPAALDLAYRQIGKHGLSGKNARLICSDQFGAEQLGDERFDFIWCFSVLYHLTDELVSRCLAEASRRLAPGGKFFANVNTEQGSSTWLEFPYLRRDLQFYLSLAAKHGLNAVALGRLQELGLRRTTLEKSDQLLRFELAR